MDVGYFNTFLNTTDKILIIDSEEMETICLAKETLLILIMDTNLIG